jgi:hypothetical protein
VFEHVTLLLSFIVHLRHCADAPAFVHNQLNYRARPRPLLAAAGEGGFATEPRELCCGHVTGPLSVDVGVDPPADRSPIGAVSEFDPLAGRVWPAVVRLSERFPHAHLAQIREVHTASGKHVVEESRFRPGFLARLLRRRPTLMRKVPFGNWGRGVRKTIQAGKSLAAIGARREIPECPLSRKAANCLSGRCWPISPVRHGSTNNLRALLTGGNAWQ